MVRGVDFVSFKYNKLAIVYKTFGDPARTKAELEILRGIYVVYFNCLAFVTIYTCVSLKSVQHNIGRIVTRVLLVKVFIPTTLLGFIASCCFIIVNRGFYSTNTRNLHSNVSEYNLYSRRLL